MTPPERHVRIVAALIAAAGLAACGLAIFAEELGIGRAPELFGWKRITLLVAGALLTAAGTLVLARPWIVSRLVSSQRLAKYSPRPAIRRWLVVGILIALLALLGIVSIPPLVDRLIDVDGRGDAPPPEASPAPPLEPSPQDHFRAMATATCERHQARLHRIAQRGYASPPSERPRWLRANASALSALRADLRRITAPPEQAAPYSDLLGRLQRIAAAHRRAAAAIEDGKRADEDRHVGDVLGAAFEARDTVLGLGLPACQ